jgi:phosphoglucomutase
MDRNEIIDKCESYLKLEEHPDFRSEVARLLKGKSFDELNDRFYRDLEFGTGGLRGVIGGGFNRMNPFVVRRATYGLARYVIKNTEQNIRAAVIAYDSRRFSRLFAGEAARVFASQGIITYLFSGPRPTPVLSYAVRRLQAVTGIVVTASHNPPEYNGYKVYWSDGGQVVPPHDEGIIKEVLSVKGSMDILSEDEFIKKNMIRIIDKEIDDPYCEMVKSQILRRGLIKSEGKKVKIVYTPLHGTGAPLIERITAELGLSITTVPEQREPDENFPTVKSPNPEESSALKMALDLGERIKADLVMGTDPDSDRLGIAVPGESGFYIVTGNQLGALLADYIFMTRKEFGRMPSKPAFVKTIVTTEMQRKISESYGVRCFDVLTGFKYIADLIREFESVSDGYTYIFGGEESYGYLSTTEVRDKDAVSAAVLAIEMALYYRSKKKTILERLFELYGQYGWYKEIQISKSFKGEKGLHLMDALMEKLRTAPPKEMAGKKVIAVKDFLKGLVVDPETGKSGKSLDLPPSNVLQFILNQGNQVSVRPSGTEPKIKFYISVCTPPGLSEFDGMKIVNLEIDALKKEIESLFND